MGATNGGLLGKYHDMKVTKCEIQYSKLFEKFTDIFPSFLFFPFFQRCSCGKTSSIQTSVIQNLSKLNKFFSALEEICQNV